MTASTAPALLPAVRPGVESVTTSSEVVTVLDGSVHLALTRAELEARHDFGGAHCREGLSVRHPEVDVAGLIDDLEAARFLVGCAPLVESGLVWTRSGLEVGGFDRLVSRRRVCRFARPVGAS